MTINVKKYKLTKKEMLKKKNNNNNNCLFTSALCVSAKTGYNMETLIDKIFRYWRWNNNSLPGDIYIIGGVYLVMSHLIFGPFN